MVVSSQIKYQQKTMEYQHKINSNAILQFISKTYQKIMLTLLQFTSLVGGFVVMLVQGSLYTFGTMSPYIYTYLYYNGSTDISISQLSAIITIACTFINIGTFFSNFKILTFPHRIHGFITVVGISVSTLILSFSQSFSLYIVFYGFVYGFFIGYGYLVPLKNTYQHLPQRKGLCTGTCLMGFGLGAFVFNFILVAIVNPDNLKQENNLFPEEVGERLPSALRILSGIYFGLGLLGILLTVPAPQRQQISTIIESSEESQEQQIKKAPHYSKRALKYAFQHKQFYLLAILVTCCPFGAFMAYHFKQYGNLYIKDDQFLSLLGSFGSVTNGLFRIIVGAIFDRVSFKKIMLVNVIVFMICCGTVFWSVHSKVTYFMSVVLTYGLYGSLFSIFPTQTIRILGKVIGAKMYYITFSGFTFGIIMEFIFHLFLVDNYGQQGYVYSFIVFGGFQIISFILIIRANFILNPVEERLLLQIRKKGRQQDNYFNRDPQKDTLVVNGD